MYDAAGNKLQKYIKMDDCDPTTGLPCFGITETTFDYIGNFVYENGELKMIYHPEGVIRPTPASASNTTAFVYDYFIKDYLGNVRVVITEEDAVEIDKFLATMEDVYATYEEENFENLDETREDLPTAYPIDASVEFNERIALLSAANGTEIGPSTILPVRRGDMVSLSTQYFFTQDAPGESYGNLGFLINEVLLAFASSGAGVLPLSEAQLLGIAQGSGTYPADLLSVFKTNMDTTDMSSPHAYLVWTAYDHEMNILPQSSGAERVRTPNQLELILREGLNVSHDGYMHVYVSNGSAKGISFDNILITYLRGKVRQINHYYPYGLSIAGLDEDFDEYLNKYTSKELQTGEFDPTTSTGLEMFDFHARFYDPQLGMWFTPDPAEQFSNPYLAMGNNPVIYVDPDGEFIWAPIIIGAMIGSFTSAMAAGLSGASPGQIMLSFGIGAIAGAISGPVAKGVNVAMAGGSFGAGFVGSATGVSSTGVLTGAVTGASAGVTNGFISGLGNGLADGKNFGQSLANGSIQGLKQGAIGGVTGGIIGGIDAYSKDLNLFSGKAELDLSNGFGAHGISNTTQTVSGKYVGEYEGTSIYESAALGKGSRSGGITLPGRGIIVGEGAFSRGLAMDLVQHEYGHILQALEVGIYKFYTIIGRESLISASMNGYMGHNHNTFWTETWANFLSQNHFGSGYFANPIRFPVQDISLFNLARLRPAPPFLWP